MSAPSRPEPASAGAKVVAVVQQKGGAGKTTSVVNLAAVSGESNPAPEGQSAPVVAIGVDPQGSLEQWARRIREEHLPFDYLVTKGKPGQIPAVLKDPTVRRLWVDTPGFIDVDPDAPLGTDPLGAGRTADALRETLDHTDLALVPITPEFLSRAPAEFTIENVLKPRRIPFIVVINLWDSGSDRTGKDLAVAQAWCDQRGYRRAPHPIRKYKIHAKAAEDGLTVIQYADNGTSLRAKQDFYRLALTIEQAL